MPLHVISILQEYLDIAKRYDLHPVSLAIGIGLIVFFYIFGCANPVLCDDFIVQSFA
jgi:hypothetical protein